MEERERLQGGVGRALLRPLRERAGELARRERLQRPDQLAALEGGEVLVEARVEDVQHHVGRDEARHLLVGVAVVQGEEVFLPALDHHEAVLREQRLGGGRERGRSGEQQQGQRAHRRQNPSWGAAQGAPGGQQYGTNTQAPAPAPGQDCVREQDSEAQYPRTGPASTVTQLAAKRLVQSESVVHAGWQAPSMQAAPEGQVPASPQALRHSRCTWGTKSEVD